MTPGPWLLYEALVGDAAVFQIRAGSKRVSRPCIDAIPIPAS
jgi:hypothetical protein